MELRVRRLLQLQRQPVRSIEVASCSCEKAVHPGAVLCQMIRRNNGGSVTAYQCDEDDQSVDPSKVNGEHQEPELA
jgi:hypothetical protein